MIVQAETAAAKFDYQGETFYFCAVNCYNKFRQNPENYLQKEAKPEPMTSSEAEFTCPMLRNLKL